MKRGIKFDLGAIVKIVGIIQQVTIFKGIATARTEQKWACMLPDIF